MAEPPHTWDLLTSSLAVSDLSNPAAVWAFLVVQGLVRDAPGDRELFASLVREELANQVTGPTDARRIATRLTGESLALPGAWAADPWGKIAAGRLQEIESWTGGQQAKKYLDQLRAAGL